MVLVILMQRPKSEGLGAAFGGGVTENIFGAQTTNVLTKITSWLAAIFFMLTFGLSILYAHKNGSQSNLKSELMKGEPTPDPTSPTPASSPDGAISTSPAPGSSQSPGAGTPGPAATRTPHSQTPAPSTTPADLATATPTRVSATPVPAPSVPAAVAATPAPEATASTADSSAPTAAPSTHRRRRHR